MTPTRYTPKTGIQIARLDIYGVPFWQHIDTNDGGRAQVGPQYRTKAELLADHERYLLEAGWLDANQADSANAHLISAAPDLLAALQALFRECVMTHKHWGEGCNQKQADQAIKDARAALLKACPQGQVIPDTDN
jgi:hypothetical protein